MMDQDFRKLLEQARDHVMTPKEMYEQRVSWIIGQTDVNREEAVEALAKQGMIDPEISTQKIKNLIENLDVIYRKLFEAQQFIYSEKPFDRGYFLIDSAIMKLMKCTLNLKDEIRN